MSTRKPKRERVRVLYSWDGTLYTHAPNWKRAKVLTQAELQALQARYTLVIERYE